MFGIKRYDTGEFLTFFDPDWVPDTGYEGISGFTTWGEAKDAMKFPSFVDGLAFWQSPSTLFPIRPDGKPNRPLTHYTVEVVEVD